jgi:glucokinase
MDRHNNRKGLEGVSGTLEALASGYGIADIARELAKTDAASVLYSLDDEDIDARKVFEAAKNGDRLAGEIICNVAGYLSVSIDTLIKLFNTECIVLSGGLVQNGDLLLGKIREQVTRYSLSGVSRTVPIVQSGFGENAALMGSFSLILERILLLESLE